MSLFFGYDEERIDDEVLELSLKMKNFFNDGNISLATDCLQRIVSKVFTKVIAIKYYNLDPLKTIELMRLMNFSDDEIDYAKEMLGIYSLNVQSDLMKNIMKLDNLKHDKCNIFEIKPDDMDSVKGLKIKLNKFKDWYESKARHKCYKDVNSILLERSEPKMTPDMVTLSESESERIYSKYSHYLVKGIVVEMEDKKYGCGGGGGSSSKSASI